MNFFDLKRTSKVCTVAVALLVPVAASAVSETVWSGANGPWSTATEWSGGLPDGAKNVSIPQGEVELNTYANARLFQIGCEAGKSASLTVEPGGTLEIGSAGNSRLGAGDGSAGTILQKGGSVVVGNNVYIGGFRASGDAKGAYTLQDGTLRVYRGDLVLGGNLTGSSVSRFEQQGGEVELRGLFIGSGRYLGMKGSPVNEAEYVITGGSLRIIKELTIGSASTDGNGSVNAMLRIGAGTDILARGNVVFNAHDKSHPTLSYILDSNGTGTLRAVNTADVSLAGTLQLEMPAGLTAFAGDSLSLLEAGNGKVSGEFSSLPAPSLWSLESKAIDKKRSALRLTLNPQARLASLGAGETAVFAASTTGYAVLTGLTAGEPYQATLSVQADSADGLDAWVTSLKEAGFGVEVADDQTNALTLSGTASAPTLTLAWDLAVRAPGLSVTGISR
jgi:hypothetical protein